MEEADGDSNESAQGETTTEQHAVCEVRSPGVIVGSSSNPSLSTKADAGGERDERPSLSYKGTSRLKGQLNAYLILLPFQT